LTLVEAAAVAAVRERDIVMTSVLSEEANPRWISLSLFFFPAALYTNRL
jgi:hypothetical protein